MKWAVVQVRPTALVDGVDAVTRKQRAEGPRQVAIE
jgi:hypothetical protein